MYVRRALALATVVPLFLAGCGGGDPSDDPTPIVPDPTTSSATPTQTATPEQESAEDFIRRWMDATRDVQASGDTSAYREFGPTCEPCSTFADSVDRIYEDGSSIDLASLRVVSVKRAGKDVGQYRLVRVLGRTVVRDASGNETQSFDGGREVLNVYLERTPEGWVVRNFTRTMA